MNVSKTNKKLHPFLIYVIYGKITSLDNCPPEPPGGQLDEKLTNSIYLASLDDFKTLLKLKQVTQVHICSFQLVQGNCMYPFPRPIKGCRKELMLKT